MEKLDIGASGRDIRLAGDKIGLGLIQRDIGLVEIGRGADRLGGEFAGALLSDLGAAERRFSVA